MRITTISSAAVLLVAAGVSGTAMADPAETQGGLKIKTEDGRFEGSLGGRVHFDYAAAHADEVTDKSPDGFYVRRAYISLAGKLYGFKYKLESDIKGVDPEAKDMWVGTDLLYGFVKAGHMAPAYGMEQLTSSNDILFVERPYISNNTIFAGREYQNGISYDTNANGFTFMATFYTANPGQEKSASSAPNDGKGYAARLTFAPMSGDNGTVHFGVSYDSANYQAVGAGSDAKASYVAKVGPSLTILDTATFDSQDTVTGELALAFGPAFLQGEYAKASFDGDAVDSQDVTSYYVQASFFVTGESKKYKAASGVFSSPKPKNDFGAVELKARYDVVKNDDSANEEKASTTSFGVNYYINPKVRLMLDYNIGKAESNAMAKDDKPSAIVARGQISF